MIDPNLHLALRRAAGEAFATLPVLAAYAHGSRVAGTPRSCSDLDVGYYLEGYW